MKILIAVLFTFGIALAVTPSKASAQRSVGHSPVDSWGTTCSDDADCNQKFREHMCYDHHDQRWWEPGMRSCTAAGGPQSVKWPIAFTVMPAFGAAVVTGLQWADYESKKSDQEINSSASGGKTAAEPVEQPNYAKGAVTGAVVAEAVTVFAFTMTKVGKFQAPLPSDPWWKRFRASTGSDRYGATRMGVTWR